MVAVYPVQVTTNISSTVDVLINKGNGTFAAPVSYPIGELDNVTIEVAVADFNHDGNLDIALNAGGSDATVLFGNGKGAFTVNTFGWGGEPFGGAVTADFTEDGKPDLAMVQLNGFTILLNQTK